MDLNITQKSFDSLDQREKDEILWWGFFDEPSQMWHVDFDVSKFINHSYDATVTQDGEHDDAYLIAARELNAGEELTQNYLEFESPEDLPPLAQIFGTIAVWQTNPRTIRFIMLAPRPLWFTYNFVVGSYAGMTAEVFILLSVLVGITRFDILGRSEKVRTS